MQLDLDMKVNLLGLAFFSYLLLYIRSKKAVHFKHG